MSTAPLALSIQWMRSLVFVVQMYVAMAVLALLFAAPTIVSGRHAYLGIRLYCRWVRWTAHRIAGVRSEVRGQVPSGKALICSKHQSFFDILIICSVVERPRFVMKKELRNVPIIGFYGRQIGCIVVDRGTRSEAVAQMLEQAEEFDKAGGQLIIYPQGTRVSPGVSAPYKIGAALLYQRLSCTCHPAATNVGLFWPRRSIMRHAGVAVIEFLQPIQPGLPPEDFMAQLEHSIETNSDRLMKCAGFEKRRRSSP
ncbi:MAG: lysophospholipid acyltransferase family protein [Rhodobacteraceae bacterium]|nr:lysophospholipid acyltransferase family protein [Paracoccaceae bacterium]